MTYYVEIHLEDIVLIQLAVLLKLDKDRDALAQVCLHVCLLGLNLMVIIHAYGHTSARVH